MMDESPGQRAGAAGDSGSAGTAGDSGSAGTREWRPLEGREAIAEAEIGHTEIRPSLARALAAALLLLVFGVPGAQHLHELGAWWRGGPTVVWDQFEGLLDGVASPDLRPAEARWGLPGRVFAANRVVLGNIAGFETALEDESLFGRRVRPPVQAFLAGWLGAGNEQAYCGVHPWLFYRPGIDYLTGPGFLEPAQLARRRAEGTEWQPAPQPDPRPAILQFHRQLLDRGIRLVLMPTPIKPTVHPERFAPAYSGRATPLQNSSYSGLVADLEAHGVLVFDVAQALVEAKRAEARPQFLATDTHWRPEAMELAADLLADFLQRHVNLPEVPDPGYRSRTVEVDNLGDIAVMLDLPEGQALYPRERVRLRQVLGLEGGRWRPDPAADLLVLGDSFSNVYSLAGMGWGESAGLVEQLAYRLRRPLDRMVRNDDGAYATRQLLARELARGDDRLAGKRAVVWQFAARELAVGDWRLMELEAPRREATPFLTLEPGAEVVVRGIVRAAAPVPRPGTVPYRDHIRALHLVGVESPERRLDGSQALVYVWSMRDNVWTEAARYRAGQQVELRIRPWSDVAEELEGVNRSDLDEEELLTVEPLWGEPVR